MTHLGNLYGKGLGVPQDYQQARQWYEKSDGCKMGQVAIKRFSSPPVNISPVLEITPRFALKLFVEHRACEVHWPPPCFGL